MTAPEIVRIRASAWSMFFDCPHMFEAKHLLGMRMPSNLRAHLGTSLHRSTAAFDKGRVDKAGYTADDTAGVFVDSLQNLEDVELSTLDDISVAQAEKIGLTLHGKYCNDVSPKFDYVAVELETEPLDVDVGNNLTVRITGTMDRQRIRAVKKKQGKKKAKTGIAITDVKSGKRAAKKDGTADTKAHQLQLGVYELLAEYAMNQDINGPATIIGLQTTNMAHVGISEIDNPQLTLIGTENQPGLIQMAAQMLKAGLFPPNPRSMLCHPRYCPRRRENLPKGHHDACIFHD